MTARDVFEQEFMPERLEQVFTERLSHSATVGKDGVHPAVFAQNLQAEVRRVAAKVRDGTYQFTTFKQKLILKGPKKHPREISIATVRDRVALRALTNVLMDVFEDARLPPAHYIIEEVIDFIHPLNDEYVFIQIDVKDFYPSVLHSALLNRLRTRIRYKPLLDLVLKAVRNPTGEIKQSEINPRGIPQGLSISNILSSIYMSKFDDEARSRFTYYRYVDDILVVCKSADSKRYFGFLEKRLRAIGLECHRLQEKNSKSKIVALSKGVDYLGYHLTPSLVSVRKSSYRRMIDNIVKVLTAAKHTAKHEKILLRLNLKITGCIFNGKRMGWMFFFSMTQDISQLQRLDALVQKEWRRLGMERYGQPKRFVKAYHEINFNLAASRYIPRFDDYTLEQKIEFIAKMLVKDVAYVSSWKKEDINRQFLKLIKKEMAELEKDVTPVS